VTEPEPYESPPVASRFRVTEDRAGAGAPSSEFWRRPPAKPQPPDAAPIADEPAPEPEIFAELAADAELTAGAPATETPAGLAAPLPPGGPRFVGSAPIPAPRRGWRRRSPRRVPDGGPLGTFQQTWSLPAPSRSRRWRPVVIPVLVLVILGVAAYVAYPHVRTVIRARSAPAGLRSYVQGHGVVYAPVGQGYSVRLPGAPVHRDQQVTSSDGKRSMFVRRSISAGTGYQIVVRVDELPKGTKLPLGLPGALQDPFLAGSDAPASVHKVAIAGETAYEGQVHARNVLPFEVAVAMHRDRLYVIRIESESVGTVFDAVAKSFRFTP
jgi:hypothetical protein